MKSIKLANSPITYFISGIDHTEWILFIHAAFVNHNMFQTQIDYFRDKYNILTLDIIGHGKSTKVRKGDSIDKMSAWISEILKTEKIEKIHIVGISLGAVLAQDFANQYPEAVQSLACFGGYDINNFDAKMQKENSASQTLMMLKATPRNSRNRILRNGMMTKRTESPRLCSRKAHGFRPAGNACQPEPSSPARTAYSVWRSASAVLGIAFFGTGTAL